ncbi:MAG: tetratricopeptide repeat protein, partial [bacterium]|nr:tetratricopeptide repeat protein [bacterium]
TQAAVEQLAGPATSSAPVSDDDLYGGAPMLGSPLSDDDLYGGAPVWDTGAAADVQLGAIDSTSSAEPIVSQPVQSAENSEEAKTDNSFAPELAESVIEQTAIDTPSVTAANNEPGAEVSSEEVSSEAETVAQEDTSLTVMTAEPILASEPEVAVIELASEESAEEVPVTVNETVVVTEDVENVPESKEELEPAQEEHIQPVSLNKSAYDDSSLASDIPENCEQIGHVEEAINEISAEIATEVGLSKDNVSVDNASVDASVPAEEIHIRQDGLSSLIVEKEFDEASVSDAMRMREKLAGADVTTAIGSYRKAIEETPDNLILRSDLADVHLRYGLLDDAVSQYRQVLRCKPDSIALRHRLAYAYLWNAEYDDAVDTFLSLADLHVQNGQNNDAIDVLQTVTSLQPNNFEARRRLIDCFLSVGQEDLGVHHLQLLAEAAFAVNDVDEAIGALKRLMEITKDTAPQERLAHVYETMGDVGEAVENYRQLAETYKGREDWTDATRVTQKIVALAPDDLAGRHDLIMLYQKLGQHDLALSTQYELANIYHEQNNLEQAIDLYEAVVHTAPDHFEARRKLVDCYIECADLQGALSRVEPLTKRYQEQKLFDNAIELYQRLCAVEPSNISLREKLLSFCEAADYKDQMLEQLLILVDLHEGNQSYREAVRALRRAVEIAPERDDLHYRLACFYDEKLGSISGVMQELQCVYELNPGNAAAMGRYAQLLMDQQRAREAAQVLMKLTSKDTEAGKEQTAKINSDYLARIEANAEDWATRFVYGELCFYMRRTQEAIAQFQKTVRNKDFELRSYNMLGQAFAQDRRFGIVMAKKTFSKGLAANGHAEEEYLELRYNFGRLLKDNNCPQEALKEFRDILSIDASYRDTQFLVQEIQDNIASGRRSSPDSSGV